MKKILGYVLPLGFAAFLLWYAYKDMDFSQMGADISKANYWAVLATFVTTIIAHWIRALRWNMLFEPVGHQPSSKDSFLAVMSGYFANLIIPRAGEVTRCTVLLTSEKIPLQTSIGTVIAERGLDLVMFGLLTLAVFGIEFQTLSNFLSEQNQKYGGTGESGTDLKLILLGVVIVGAALAYLFRKPLSQISFVGKILTFAKGLLDGLLSVTKLKNPALFIFYSCAIWGCYYLTTYFSLSMFDFTYDLGFKAAFMLLVIGSFGIIIPVPGAVGGPFQLFVSAALVELYMKEPTMSLTAASMMYWSQTFFTLVVGGICYLISVVLANRIADRKPSKETVAHV